jgi:hypothetical protein
MGQMAGEYCYPTGGVSEPWFVVFGLVAVVLVLLAPRARWWLKRYCDPDLVERCLWIAAVVSAVLTLCLWAEWAWETSECVVVEPTGDGAPYPLP